MKLMKITAIALFLPLAAMAQSEDVDAMGEGLSMLGVSAENAFRQLNIDADPSTLTVAQLAEIHAILSGEDNSGVQRGRIMAIVENE